MIIHFQGSGLDLLFNVTGKVIHFKWSGLNLLIYVTGQVCTRGYPFSSVRFEPIILCHGSGLDPWSSIFKGQV